MTCIDCIHSDVCAAMGDNTDDLIMWIAQNLTDNDECRFFKDKSLSAELPCEKGDFIIWQFGEDSFFFNGGLYEIFEVKGFINTDSLGWRLDLSGFSPIFNHPSIKGYYKTKEEAEKALAERNSKDEQC